MGTKYVVLDVFSFFVFTYPLIPKLSDLDHSFWNRIVREQVQRINDPTCDITTAFDLMDQQNNLCDLCRYQLTKDTKPSLIKSKKRYTFLTMQSTEITFHWICNFCSSHLNIATYLKEEEQKYYKEQEQEQEQEQ